jgi:hypothetical protein
MTGRGFLPHVQVTTLVWAHDVEHEWYAAQGDDLQRQIPTIELNLLKVARESGGDVERAAQSLVDNWLAIYVVLCTRQGLIDKRARGLLSGEAEVILAEANLKAIKASPRLNEHYVRVAIEAIKRSRPYIALEGFAALFQNILERLDATLATMEAEAAIREARAKMQLRDMGLFREEP